MPRSVSAKKRVRQNRRRKEHNRMIKSRIRTARRAFLKAVESGDLAVATERFKAAERLLHRAGNKGPLHNNTAARIIGRMQSRLSALARKAAAAK